MLESLRVYELKEELEAPFPESQPWRVLLSSPTGSGKSTGIAPMLLGQTEGLILVVQPRRIAARMLAGRVAQILGERVGQTVGYSVRHDSNYCGKTRILFITDGMLQRYFVEDHTLSRVGCVVFDEFHERRISSDISLAKCIHLQETSRPELKLCVMSATLNSELLKDYLEPCRLLESEGRSFPVEIRHLADPVQQKTSRSMKGSSQTALWERTVKVCQRAIREDRAGHILIFMPGVYEIQRCIDQLQYLAEAKNYSIHALYSALPAEKQDLAVLGKGAGLRIIVATNVAETSLTIDGVSVVIDSGLARVARYDAARGLNSLMIESISQASAKQRAGRAGRTAEGICYRLWSERQHASRAEFETAEVKRVEVSEALLLIAHYQAIEKKHLEEFRWLERPEAQRYELAKGVLIELGALDESGETLTEIGQDLLGFPLHPRYARLLLAGQTLNCLAETLFIAALSQGQSLFRKKAGVVGKDAYTYDEDQSDFEAEYRAYETARQMQFQPSRCEQAGIIAREARDLERMLKQLTAAIQSRGWEIASLDFSANHKSIEKALLQAFPSQVGVPVSSSQVARMVGGRSAQLASDSPVKSAELFLATECTEVGAKDIIIHLSRCITLSQESLKEVWPEHLTLSEGAHYDETSRRVVEKREICYQGLVIESKSGPNPSADLAAQILAERVAAGELKLKHWNGEVEQWIARLLSLRAWMPELELPSFDEEDRALALVQICEGALGYKDIKNREVMPALESWLSAGQHASLDAYAPVRMKLANGQSVKVRYKLGQPPTISLVVQRLYGVKETPTIANGVALQINICAPNQRPWQMTADLASFWQSGFAQMKKDLAGRYPKHNWEPPAH